MTSSPAPVIGPCDPQDLMTPTTGVSRVQVSSPSAAGLVFNLTFDDAGMATAGLSAADITNVHNACTYAANQFRVNFNDNIHVNITVTAVAGTGTLGQSSTPIFVNNTFATVRGGVVADAKTADDTTTLGAGGSMPVADPIGAAHGYTITRAQRKALGLVADDAVTSDGTYTFGAGHTYTYDPNSRAVSGKIDYIGVTMHEFSEIMGRIGLMGQSFSGTPNYMQFDLFHYTGVGTRGMTNGAGRFFSFDNGTTNLKAFNNASTLGGDLQDWASGTNDAFNAFSSSGVKNDMTTVDLQAMDVIGYDRTAPTAASVSISGRVLTADGRGLRNAYIILTDSQGASRRVITGAFGYYRFDDVGSGNNYIISVSSRRFIFQPRVLNVNDDLNGVDLVAEP